jgi:hypothetical protein
MFDDLVRDARDRAADVLGGHDLGVSGALAHQKTSCFRKRGPEVMCGGAWAPGAVGRCGMVRFLSGLSGPD